MLLAPDRCYLCLSRWCGGKFMVEQFQTLDRAFLDSLQLGMINSKLQWLKALRNIRMFLCKLYPEVLILLILPLCYFFIDLKIRLFVQ